MRLIKKIIPIKRIILPFILLLLALSANAQFNANKGIVRDSFELPFTLALPSKTIVLPKELYEISGLSIDSDGVLRTINDEKGIIYSVDTLSGEIVNRLEFAENDDYEAISIHDNFAYVAESNGNLKKVDLKTKEKVDEYDTFLSSRNDVEGCCYHKYQDVLLLACKKEMEIVEDRNEKGIYVWDPKNEKLNDSPYYVINLLSSIVTMRQSNISDNIIVRLGVKNRLMAFAPSAIDIDPCSGLLYILSSRGRMLIVADIENDLKGIFFLPPKLYGQPEGLCFDEFGNLFISNEARSRKASILKFMRNK